MLDASMSAPGTAAVRQQQPQPCAVPSSAALDDDCSDDDEDAGERDAAVNEGWVRRPH